MKNDNVLNFNPKSAQAQVKINPDDLETVICKEEGCGCPYFEQAIIFKKISALVSPTGQGGFIPQPVFLCKNCGKLFTPEKEM